MQQFGMILEPNSEMVCCGIGPFFSSYKPSDKMKQNYIKPTHTFDKDADFNIAGKCVFLKNYLRFLSKQ